MRTAVAWLSLLLLVCACFAPWVEVTAFHGESVTFSSLGEYSGGGQIILLCAAAAAIGLLAGATGFAALSAATAAGLSIILAYQAPGNLMQLGYEAHVTWGCALAIASAGVLFVSARGATPYVRALPPAARERAPRSGRLD